MKLKAAVEDIASRIGAVVNGDSDLVIAAQIKVLDASDEGGGNLELFGTIDVQILAAKDTVVSKANLLSIPGRAGGYVVLKQNGVHRCEPKTLRIEGAAEEAARPSPKARPDMGDPIAQGRQERLPSKRDSTAATRAVESAASL